MPTSYSAPLATYIGDASVLGGQFIDQYEPVPGKSEWGMDTLERYVRGTQPNVLGYSTLLAQGQTYIWNGITWYLQTWVPDNNPIFPGFHLMYKGLVAGIPAPKASGQGIEQSIQLAAGNLSVAYSNSDGTSGTYVSATRDIRYYTRSSKTLYIATSRPVDATYGLDVNPGITVLTSVIRATDSTGKIATFNGMDAPDALVTALTPASSVQGFAECSPVVGSIYFECTDTSSLLYFGS